MAFFLVLKIFSYFLRYVKFSFNLNISDRELNVDKGFIFKIYSLIKLIKTVFIKKLFKFASQSQSLM